MKVKVTYKNGKTEIFECSEHIPIENNEFKTEVLNDTGN